MQGYTRIEELLENLYQIIESSKSSNFFSKNLKKEEALAILDEIANNLPRELAEANKILKNASKIIDDAEYEGKRIIKEAQERAELLASEHNIIRIAEEKAQIAKKEASEFYIGTKSAAVKYADTSMAEAEKSLQKSLEEISSIFKMMEERLNLEIDAIYKDRQQVKELEQEFPIEVEQIYKDR